MKKLILGIMLLSSLCFARDIEQCNGLEKELLILNEKSLNLIDDSTTMQNKLENMTVVKSDVDNFLAKNLEIEELADHIMYYHAKEMNNKNLTYTRKTKIISKKYKDVMTELKIKLDYNL